MKSCAKSDIPQLAEMGSYTPATFGDESFNFQSAWFGKHKVFLLTDLVDIVMRVKSKEIHHLSSKHFNSVNEKKRSVLKSVRKVNYLKQNSYGEMDELLSTRLNVSVIGIMEKNYIKLVAKCFSVPFFCNIIYARHEKQSKD